MFLYVLVNDTKTLYISAQLRIFLHVHQCSGSRGSVTILWIQISLWSAYGHEAWHRQHELWGHIILPFTPYPFVTLVTKQCRHEQELLALGERIGNVSTGLSETLISKCLTELIYCSSDQFQEEEKCIICLVRTHATSHIMHALYRFP